MKFHLIEKIAYKWQLVGVLIGIEKGQLEFISVQYQNNIEECCQAVLTRWQENPPPDYPPTWGGLIELLEDSNLAEVITELKDALSKAYFT